MSKQIDILNLGTSRTKARRRLNKVCAGSLDGMTDRLFGFLRQIARFDNDLERRIGHGLAHGSNIVLDRLVIASLDHALIDHHIDFGGTVGVGIGRFGGFRSARHIAKRESDDRGKRKIGISLVGTGDIRRRDACAGTTILECLGTNGINLIPSRRRLKQCIVDARAEVLIGKLRPRLGGNGGNRRRIVQILIDLGQKARIVNGIDIGHVKLNGMT